MDVGLDALHGVVFGGGHLLEGCRMHHIIDPAHRHGQPIGIPNIPDEVAHARRIVFLLHFKLFELIA
ncbi:hypothetical protein D3C79_724830 [compost metagenome]